MDQVPAQEEIKPQVIAPGRFRLPNSKIVLAVLAVLVLVFAGFKFFPGRLGKFWEKKIVSEKVTLARPVPEALFREAKVINEGESFQALGFNLPKGTTILAAFSGKIEDEPKFPNRPPTQALIYLRDSQGNEATYSFYGAASVTPGTNVKAGDKIGEIVEGQFPSVAPFIGLNSVFILKKDGKFIPLSLADFAR